MRGNYQKRLSRFLVRSTDKCVFTASKPRTARIYVGHLLEPRVLDAQRTTTIYTTYDVLCIRLTIAGHCVLITGTARPADLVHSIRCVTSYTLLHSCVHCWPYDPSVSQQWECRELRVNFLFFVHCWWINESLLVVLAKKHEDGFDSVTNIMFSVLWLFGLTLVLHLHIKHLCGADVLTKYIKSFPHL